ncbi:MAG: amylo-alpha-1,6-glucosidase [Bryobacteraceae bacterium]
MTIDPIRLSQELGKEHEWLETNGLGGYSSGTVTGIHTRRYHGLLVAATAPPVGRLVMLSKFEEALIVDGKRFEFSANEYPGVIHPNGAQYLCEFRLDPFPTFVYQIAGLEIEKRIFMVHGENTTVVEYELRALDWDPLPECHLELRPFLAFRDYHSTAYRNDAIDGAFTAVDGGTELRPYRDLPPLYLGHRGATVEVAGHWYHDFEYSVERERGLDFREDLFNPLVLRFPLNSKCVAAVIASTMPRNSEDTTRLRELEQRRRANLADSIDSDSSLVRRLAVAADQFIVKRGEGKTIIAGYHWFSDWGRDTMIALPGLTLATGRFDIAREILATFGGSIDQGMLPNRFPDQGEMPEYNTVDATLWYFEAVRAYLAYTGDYAFVQAQIYPRLKDILNWHLGGTCYGIHVDEDCLLACGEPGVQLTWMDAKVGDWVVTPRTGKPVEIQALWYNALSIMEDLAAAFGDQDLQVLTRDAAITAKTNFNAKFWNSDANCLYDVIGAESPDISIRPNQIFAVSLHHSMLDGTRARQVVDVVHRELLTPLGLRTLAAGDSQYRARYEGGVTERDGSYHQGTVWPWLLGPFVTAYVRTHGRSECSRHQALLWLRGIEDHMKEACLGQISEIADAGFPHRPKGCAAQAWSVAKLLRSAVEDVFEIRQRVSLAA